MSPRIAIISEHASPAADPGGTDCGGQNVYVAQIARRLARLGYAVDVFCRRDSPLRPELQLWDDGVRIVHVPAGPAQVLPKEELLPYMADFTDVVCQMMRQRAYDLVHANFWMSGLVAAEVKARLGIPFVITLHALGQVRRRYLGSADAFPQQRERIEAAVIAAADRVIAECPQDQDDLIALYAADPARISIVPCGVDASELWPIDRSLARATLGLEFCEPMVLQLGRLVQRKGMDIGIRALRLLREDYGVNARMLIVGGDSVEPDPVRTPEIGRLQAVARHERVLDRVAFVGRRERDALKYYYSAADVFVSTPWYEPFGLTPIEAMACGTPVIGSNVGGIKYTVRDCDTGYLVAPDDPRGVAERLAHLLLQPELRSLFGRNAQAHVQRSFRWETVVDQLTGVYAEVVPSLHGRAPARQVVECELRDAEAVLRRTAAAGGVQVAEAAQQIAACLRSGGSVLTCGNGGSAAQASHFAAEFVGRFKAPRRASLAVLALGTDPAVLTAWSNDCSFDDVFAREVEAYGRSGDVLVVFSTSGKSRNVVRALECARSRGLTCIGFVGEDAADTAPFLDVAIRVPSSDTQRVQEVHAVLVHALCGLVESSLTRVSVMTSAAGASV
jgi:phosphoheptose isomerase/glycosyltransferase involved in cell wall biosynthesis